MCVTIDFVFKKCKLKSLLQHVIPSTLSKGKKRERLCLTVSCFLSIIIDSAHFVNFYFSRSRFLHVWNLENKRLLYVIQLPAKVRLARQLEFMNDSFDGGASQVTYHFWVILKI